MIKLLARILMICATSGALRAQTRSGPLTRHYVEGEKLTYHMKGINESWHYEIQADGIVKKGPDGTYYEDYGWSNLISNGQMDPLSGPALNLRQQVSLDPNRPPSMPDLSQAPKIVGPITDLMTFYVDVWMAARTDKLMKPGDHVYLKLGTPSSWADGVRVLQGDSSIDFDFTLREINQKAGTVTLIARHVPPEQTQLKLPAEWMRKPVAGAPNNWVTVEKTRDGKFLGAVGKEVFDVEIKLSLADGKILSVTMDNPVVTIERECSDQTLTNCGDPRSHTIRRQIEMSLVHPAGNLGTSDAPGPQL